MKKLLSIIFLNLCCLKSFALSSEDLENAFNGQSPLYVVNVTKHGTDSLSPDEIAPLFKNLKECIQKGEINNILCFIIFNEYFFGKEPLTTEIKNKLLQQFSEFENAIFVVNFVSLEQKLVSVYEIDRAINILNSSFSKDEILEKKNLISTIEGKHSLRQFQLENTIQFAERKFLPRQTGLSEKYLLFLNELLKKSTFEICNILCLENNTIYYHKNVCLMKYNKATYFNEFLLPILSRNKYPFYCFGCGIDLIIDNENLIAKILQANVSTEICKDVSIGIRKDSLARKLHIIQSNTIKAENYINYMPSFNYLIISDPIHNMCLNKTRHLINSKISFQSQGITFSIFELNFN